MLSDCLTCTWDGVLTILTMRWYAVSRRRWGGSLILSREFVVKFFRANSFKTAFASGEQLSMNDFWVSIIARTFLWKWTTNSKCTLEHQETHCTIFCAPVAGKHGMGLEEVAGHWMGYLVFYTSEFTELDFFLEAFKEEILCLRLLVQGTPSCASAHMCLCSLSSLPADRIFWSELTFPPVKQCPN